MPSETGFATMGRASGGGDVAPIGVGMLGYAFMGKAHSNAYKTLRYMTWPPPMMPELVSIAGRNEQAVSEAARRTLPRWRLRTEEVSPCASGRDRLRLVGCTP